MTAIGRRHQATRDAEIDPDSAPLTSDDLNRLSTVEASLARGLVIKSWWDGKNGDTATPLDFDSAPSRLAAKGFGQSFPLMRSTRFWPHDVSYGFYDHINQDGLNLAVMGCFQQFFYDQPTLRIRNALRQVAEIPSELIERVAAEVMVNWRSNLREFVLGTFIKTTSRMPPYPHVDEDRAPIASYLKRFSWCPEGPGPRTGMHHSQLYYKRLDNGRVGKFWPAHYRQINLREIGTRYAWIVIEDDVSGFDLEFRLDDETPYIGVPIIEKQFGVISPELIVAEEAPGEFARYGFGFALLKQAGSGGPEGLPPPYDVGLQQTEFWLGEDGEILVQDYLIAERPKRISVLKVDGLGLGISVVDRASLGVFSEFLKPLADTARRLPVVGQFDPILAYVSAANAVSGGFAGKELCINTGQLERQILFKHYLKQFETVLGTRGIWRHRRDWTKPETTHGH